MTTHILTIEGCEVVNRGDRVTILAMDGYVMDFNLWKDPKTGITRMLMGDDQQPPTEPYHFTLRKMAHDLLNPFSGASP